MKDGAICENACWPADACSDGERVEQISVALSTQSQPFLNVHPYAAATAILSYFMSFLGDVNRREEPDSPDSVMRRRALAQRRSRTM